MGWGLGGEGRGCSKEGVVWRASCWGGGEEQTSEC